MLGLTRRRRVEGWAVDAVETNADVGRATLMQRLAQNNRLWIACMILIVVVGLYLAFAGSGLPDENMTGGRKTQDTFYDARHRTFADDLPTRPYMKGLVIGASFPDRETFWITLKSGTSLEDVGYAARIAGTQIARKFGYRPVIMAYVAGPDGQRSAKPVLTATYDLNSSGYVSTPTKADKPTD